MLDVISTLMGSRIAPLGGSPTVKVGPVTESGGANTVAATPETDPEGVPARPDDVLPLAFINGDLRSASNADNAALHAEQALDQIEMYA